MKANIFLLRWITKLYIWATYRLYNEFAWAYDLVSWLVSLGRWASWRRLALEYVVGDRVLEIGFGTGELLVEMASQKINVIGLDQSLAMHRITSRKMRRKGLLVPCLRGVAQQMPFVDGIFDTIVSTFPAGYILEAETIKECARLLRHSSAGIPHGGRLIIVGMYLQVDNPLLQRTVEPIYGSPESCFLDGFVKTALDAGLQTRVVYRNDSRIKMPVILLEK